MTDLAKLVVKLEAQSAKYQKELESANRKLGRFEKRTKKSIGNIKVAFGALGGIVAFKKIFDATAKQEQAFKQLEQGIASTNKQVGFSARELAGYASELQAATTFGDESIIEAQSQLVTFTRITGEEFKKTTELALDMSARFGVDLKSATLQLGKALNDPVANLSALSRAGIQFSKSQKDVIKSLVESGRLTDAQNLILKELEVQFGGSARAARDTFGGALQALGNNLGDLLEGDGGLNDAKDSIERFNKQLADPKTKRAAQELISKLIDGFSNLASIMAEIPDFAKWLGEEIAAAIHGPNDLIRINDELAEKTNDLAQAQQQLDAALKQTSQSQYGFNVGSDPRIIEARIEAIGREIETLNERKALLEPTLSPTEKPKLPEVVKTGLGNAGGSGANNLDTSVLDDADRLSQLAERIVSETTPKIEAVNAKIVDTSKLLSQGLLTEEQADAALAVYIDQLSNLEFADLQAHQDKLTRLSEGFASEMELLTAQRDERLALLNDQKTQELLSEQEIAELKLKINQDYHQAKIDLEKKSASSVLSIAENSLTGINTALTKSGRTGFNESKKMKKANALIATKDAAVSAYSALAGIPIIGPALGVAAAIAATKYGMNQVAGISSSQYGSSGSGGTGAPSSVSASSGGASRFRTPQAANDVNNAQEQAEAMAESKRVEVSMTVDDFTGEPMRLLFEKMNEESADMGFEFSAQGQGL
ncbi:phage tail length tape measure family protein [Pleionea sediminis]|uniref:phage tail length tape measure family protein n=1 Tax=Pleionea sediminis TaxID=2569479 RepID=UPI0011862317|nr:phage tail length tape measure family protein [Pleionea sediminis]